MLKFFRKIRQNLIAEHRVSKYLLYALGEIILVMIGILLAVQVNDWSKERERNALEQKMLKELLINLRADSLDNTINAEWLANTEQSAAFIVNALESRIPWHDSMAVHYGRMFTHGVATLNTSAYDNLKSIGFDLISNDSIRMELTHLHSISYALLQKSEKEFAIDNGNQMVFPILVSRLKMERWFHAVPLDYERLLDDLEFRETVRWRGITMGYVKGNTNDANRRVNRLMRMIEREIESNKET